MVLYKQKENKQQGGTMSRKNTISKAYMSDNEKFADVFNFYVYHGKQKIKPEYLSERDITEISLPRDGEKEIFAVEKYRDILKQCVIKQDTENIYVLMGIENQSDIHYAMPVRNMLYDALNYSGQVAAKAKKNKNNQKKKSSGEFLSGMMKEEKLIPVVTLVIYWGNLDWDAPRNLHDMLDSTDEDILKYVSDYHINLIVPKEIQDFSKFQSEMGKVLEFISVSGDREKMKKVIYENEKAYLHMDVDSATMISEFTNTKLDIKNHKDEEEGVNMCKAIDDMIKEAVEEKETEMCKAFDDMIKEAVDEKEKEMCKAIDDMILEGRQEGIQTGAIRATIEVESKYGNSKEGIITEITNKYKISEQKAKEEVERYYEVA